MSFNHNWSSFLFFFETVHCVAEPWGNHCNKMSIYKSLVSIVCSLLISVSRHLAQSLACPTCSGNIGSECTKGFLDSVTSLLHVLSIPRVEDMALFSRCLQDLAIANVELLTYARRCVICFTYIMSLSHPNCSVRKWVLSPLNRWENRGAKVHLQVCGGIILHSSLCDPCHSRASTFHHYIMLVYITTDLDTGLISPLTLRQVNALCWILSLK